MEKFSELFLRYVSTLGGEIVSKLQAVCFFLYGWSLPCSENLGVSDLCHVDLTWGRANLGVCLELAEIRETNRAVVMVARALVEASFEAPMPLKIVF